MRQKHEADFEAKTDHGFPIVRVTQVADPKWGAPNACIIPHPVTFSMGDIDTLIALLAEAQEHMKQRLALVGKEPTIASKQ